MAEVLDKPIEGAERLTYEGLRGRDAQSGERAIEPFLAELARMTPQERGRASRYSFNRRERWVWAGRYPDEAPLLNGELEWIASTLADNE